MNDNEKHNNFAQDLIDQNEREFGAEVRQKYGDKAMDESNSRIAGITPEEYVRGEIKLAEFEAALLAAFNDGDPAGELAHQACELHKQWLCIFAPRYSPEYHRALGEMYAVDERFRKNYNKLAGGCAEFLRDAINAYCSV